jgi:iron complex outermembrane receptor protein
MQIGLQGKLSMPKYIVAVLGCTAAVGLCASPAFAQSPAQTLPSVEIQQKKPTKDTKKRAPAATSQHVQRDAEPPLSSAPASTSTVTGEAIASQKPATNDTAQLLSGTPGVSLYQSGGVSSLPSIHGLADDRVRTELDGMLITAACANHMNPPLSYIDPAAVKQVKVMAGITPVSAGGDSIGGTVRVESATPRFAVPGEGTITYGSVSVFGRSNGNGIATSGTASAATENVNITYTGSWARADDYRDGNGNKVLSSLYETENHAVSLAVRNNGDLLIVNAGVQHIPYQGFPNAPMDMTGNDAWFINSRYEGQFTWGKLAVLGYYHNVNHAMDAIIAERGDFMAMPMRTKGNDAGYQVKVEIPVSSRDLVRAGNEFHHQYLNDWWPANGADQDLIMLNGAERDRLGTFIEWERRWNRNWTTLLGFRNDTVWMNEGNIQGYWFGDSDAETFNAQNKSRTDVNFDMTALARYQESEAAIYELGFARKTRSPNLYERYIWYPSTMVGWFGDGNAYDGNINIKPEVANTVSFTANWRGQGSHDWELKVTPYYSYVQDYIDVDFEGTKMMGTLASVKFANHDAELYGADISGRYALWNSLQYGNFALTGVAGFVHGKNLDTGGSLYNMMPLNAKIALQHKLGSWTSAAELQLVDAKTDVEAARLELPTPGYALVNLRTSYEWERVRFDLGVSNLFNQQYYSPLGGKYISQWDVNMNNWSGGALPSPSLLAGEGRSVYAAVTVKF